MTGPSIPATRGPGWQEPWPRALPTAEWFLRPQGARLRAARLGDTDGPRGEPGGLPLRLYGNPGAFSGRHPGTHSSSSSLSSCGTITYENSYQSVPFERTGRRHPAHPHRGATTSTVRPDGTPAPCSEPSRPDNPAAVCGPDSGTAQEWDTVLVRLCLAEPTEQCPRVHLCRSRRRDPLPASGCPVPLCPSAIHPDAGLL